MKTPLFYPFDEWIYFKIYCSPKTAEKVLLELYPSFLKKLIKEKVIKKFFFVRYNDTGSHLRLRIQLVKEDMSYILSQLKINLSPYLDRNIIYNIELSSYQREIKRYGDHNIENIESLFFHDSDFVLQIGGLFVNENEVDKYRWISALTTLDQYLTDFNLTTEEKVNVTKYMFDSWANELVISKNTKISIDQKYRDNRVFIDSVLSKDCKDLIANKINKLNRNKSKNIKRIIISLLNDKLNSKQDLDQIICDLIHMLMNKLFILEPNRHELIIYSFAYKYYRSVLAQGKKK